MTALASDWRHAPSIEHLPTPNDTLLAALRRELTPDMPNAEAQRLWRQCLSQGATIRDLRRQVRRLERQLAKRRTH